MYKVVQMVSRIVSSIPGHTGGPGVGRDSVGSTVVKLSEETKLRVGVERTRLNVLLGRRVMVEDSRSVVMLESTTTEAVEEEMMSELDCSEVADEGRTELGSSVVEDAAEDPLGVLSDMMIIEGEGDVVTPTGG